MAENRVSEILTLVAADQFAVRITSDGTPLRKFDTTRSRLKLLSDPSEAPQLVIGMIYYEAFGKDNDRLTLASILCFHKSIKSIFSQNMFLISSLILRRNLYITVDVLRNTKAPCSKTGIWNFL